MRQLFIARPRSVPRANGGDPANIDAKFAALDCSPRKRGLSYAVGRPIKAINLFPAQAGVILSEKDFIEEYFTVPRASGGDP